MTEREFRGVFGQYYRSIYYFFYERGFPEEECRDLAQDTFLGALRSLKNFRGDASFTTWLFSIAKNIRRNALRSGGTHKRSGVEVSLETALEEGAFRVDDPGPTLDLGGPLEESLAQERARLLREALKDLPDQMRNCIVLRIDSDLGYKEIAAVLKIPLSRVQSHIFEAKKKLRRKLSKHYTELRL